MEVTQPSRSVLQIDIAKYLEYWELLSEESAPSVCLMAIVKANAYGLGAIALCKALEAQKKVQYLGVATVAEALELRQNNIHLPILILSELSQAETATALTLPNVILTVYTPDYIQHLAQIARTHNSDIRTHLKINTGMNRLGCPMNQAAQLFNLINASTGLKCEGIFTHFSCADDPQNPFTLHQLHSFQQTLSNLPLPKSILRHAANSAAYRHFPLSHLDMIRIGIDSYSECISLKSRVQTVQKVSAGQPISYSGTYTTPQDTQIAIIDLGYADGLSRNFTGTVLIHGHPYPIVGAVCMDMCMANIQNAQVQPMDEVVFIGTQHHETLSLAQYAQANGKTLYEALCSIGNRVKRIYLS